MILEIGTKNYDDDVFQIKKALSHVESLVGAYNGYVLSESSSKFGWTFFKIALKPELQTGIEEKFSDMISKYQWGNQEQKFVKFMTDFFNAKGCKDITLKMAD